MNCSLHRRRAKSLKGEVAMVSWSNTSGWCGYLTIVILTNFLNQACHIHNYGGYVQAAPPKLAQPASQVNDVKVESVIGGRSDLALASEQKTADLGPLINETLKINNKSTMLDNAPPLENGAGDKQNFRDDWTFDRVEYDLMDFLQELNARYSYANKTPQQVDASAVKLTAILDERRDNVVGRPKLGVGQAAKKVVDSHPALQQARSPLETVTKTTVEAVKKELDAVSPLNKQTTEHYQPESTKIEGSPTTPATSATSAPSSELPISLASGDQDISESTWQYGIFDRFTRARASTTTTTQAPESLSVAGSSANFDTRSLNSDECGLRSYRIDPDQFPGIGLGMQVDDTEEMTKELSQRRQKPPLGGSYFSSHKKYHHTPTSGNSFGLTADELDRDKTPADLPPYDRNGEPTGAGEPELPTTSNTSKKQELSGQTLVGDVNAGGEQGALAESGPSFSSGDSEFNLSLRRQWLQQQLGSTLHTLGFNSTNGGGLASIGDYLNQTYNMRENMMKMSASSNNYNKLGRSFESVNSKRPIVGETQAELSEQELKARQDELKLEARVIGGNDARLGDSPWSASLQALVSRPGTGGVEYRHYCGGTIISEYYILTAAHCLDFMVGRESRLYVVIGDLNWRMSAASLHGRRFGIEKLIIHGGYKSTAFGHDIGLIKTKESMKPLKVNGRYIVNSVCLPERNLEHSGEAELVGWGLFSNRNEMADSLQIADVPILPRPLCVDLYRRRTGLIQWLIGIELITEKQICAGTFGRGICQGDSGSALVFNEKVPTGGDGNNNNNNNNKPTVSSSSGGRLKSNLVRDHQQRATIIGTVAFGGIRRCSYQSLPGVYMQTSKYLDWILPRIQ